jgi:predicted transcriptional regulator
MTPAQCGAVRALINMSHAELAGAAAVPLALIADFESGAGTPRPADVEAIQKVLERAGVEFVDEIGVKLSARRR